MNPHPTGPIHDRLHEYFKAHEDDYDLEADDVDRLAAHLIGLFGPDLAIADRARGLTGGGCFGRTGNSVREFILGGGVAGSQADPAWTVTQSDERRYTSDDLQATGGSQADPAGGFPDAGVRCPTGRWHRSSLGGVNLTPGTLSTCSGCETAIIWSATRGWVAHESGGSQVDPPAPAEQRVCLVCQGQGGGCVHSMGGWVPGAHVAECNTWQTCSECSGTGRVERQP